MGFFSQASDLYSSLRFLRLLTTKWEDTNAYKYGIVDSDGKQLIKSKDVPSEHKKYYTLFHRLVFNLKRLLQKVPVVGKSILLNYASALLLLKEHLKISSDEEFKKILNEYCNFINITELNENSIQKLKEGITIELNKDMPHSNTGELIFLEGTKVKILQQETQIFGIPIYKGLHENTGQFVYLSVGDCVIHNALYEDTAVNSTSSVGNVNNVTFKKIKDRTVSIFDIDDDSFSKLINPKTKFKRWKDYIDTEHENYMKIRKCVYNGDLVILRDSKGNSCSVRNYKN